MRLKQITFLSLVAGGNPVSGLTLGEYDRGHHAKKPHIIDWGDGIFMVGDGVSNFADTEARQDFDRLAQGNEAIALCYTALGLLLGPGSHKIRGVVYGLPVDVYVNQVLADKTMRGVGDFLRGEHEFELDGEMIQVNVQSIARLAQPVGAYTAYMIGNDKKPDNSLVAVADCGFHTLDMFALRYPQVIDKFTAGASLGISRACQHFIRHFKDLTGHDISLHQANEYLHNDSPTVTYMGRKYDLAQIKDQSIDALVSDIIAFFNRQWADMPFSEVILAGGGLEFLKGHILPHYESGVKIVDDAAMSIAQGLFYQGKMKWGKSKFPVVGLDAGFGWVKAVTEDKNEGMD